MKLYLPNMDELIEINKLKRVTSPVLFERGGTPNPDGLLSNEIFGYNIRDRKETFAYIDLNTPFFNPHAYKAILRIYRDIDRIIAGTLNVSINSDGMLVKDENGSTGLKFIYDNWNKIKWEKTHGMRNERIDLLTKYPKSHIFMSKQIVLPAFYRDISSTSGGGGETSPVNNMYTKLIRLSSLLDEDSMFDFTFNNTNYTIQKTIVEIYNYFKEKLHKKSGLFRKYLLGKSGDYYTRSVIVNHSIHAETSEDNMCTYEYSAVPLGQCCVLMYLPMMHWLTKYFEREFILEKYNKPLIDPKTKRIVDYYELDNPESYFNDVYIRKALNRFIKDPGSRFDKVQVPVKGKGLMDVRIMGRRYNPDNATESSGLINRPMTWTDLLYICAEDVSQTLHLVGTRYPVLHRYGIIITKIRVNSTLETMHMEIDGKLYPWYPKVDPDLSKEKVAVSFNDCILISNAYLSGLDGDLVDQKHGHPYQ